MPSILKNREFILVAIFALLTTVLYFIPTDFDNRIADNAVRCRAEVVGVDDSEVQQFGMVKTGPQYVTLEVLEGEFAGQVLRGTNELLGQMDKDKIFKRGDEVLTVLSLDADGNVLFVNPQDHYRIGLEVAMLALFAFLLLAFGGWTGAKALFSFMFTALVLWKVLIPGLLKGADPVWLTLGVVTGLCAVIIFMVAGLNRKGVVAFLGSFLGVFTSCMLAIYFTGELHLHGAVMPFAETLLYSGFGHLDLTKIYVAAVFLACSGAVMDLAMDVAASMDEVVMANPDISTMEALASGIRVGRAVVGTMTTTLLLAYSGGFITLMMAFMAQGVPLINTFNFVYVSAEVLKTLVGSFGLVTVAPFTAIAGAFVFIRKSK
ncbi:YibE/F family protein [Maridesulfovibrio hydrothermalis]|uniref:YibE/F family protein n=1 Tax=Maridesulfovibrio hydrothermalis AM13 = DSM 14728 TaxID=1121451 RepID=L0RET4_9BACT|nr:YibE/F family protein [Maridesulfovibrio hydrothermalis]CCO24722.1 YibE/F family protein [Maridesulfovibrio hydrothermalis AM13 = DSM 14728]